MGEPRVGAEHVETRSEMFRLLSNHRRRYVWHYCKQTRESVPLGELAEQVAAWENEKPVSEITAAERKRVYTSLQQTHLPNMDDADVVQFTDGVVERSSRADELDVYIDVVERRDIPWSEYYLGLCAVSAALLAGVWVTGLGSGPGSSLAWGGTILAAFTLSAVAHVLVDRRRRPESAGLPPELQEPS